jgi:hypothetical protein
MYPDDPVSGSAFTTERNVDARPASAASDLAVRRGVNSFTRTAECWSVARTIEEMVLMGSLEPSIYVTYLLRRGARDDKSEAVYHWRQSGGPPAR